MTKHRIVLVGFGNVGRAFAHLLLERRAELRRERGLEASVVAILTKRHGSVALVDGIDLKRASAAVAAGRTLGGFGRTIQEATTAFLRKVRADVAVEVTPLRIAPKQPALDHIVASLSSRKHVITANKGPVVYHYRRLRTLARRMGVGFRYEGTVMDGAPVFNLFQETLRGAHLKSFEGILNSVSNFLLGTVEAGGSLQAGLQEARTMGLLEADPSLDLEGWDAAVKACILANILMGGRVRPETVPREGIADLDWDRVRKARARGSRLKQIARGWADGGQVHAAVRIEEVPVDHPLAAVAGTSNALLARTDLLGDIVISERHPGVRQTAFALYSDLIAIHEGRLRP